MNNPLFKFKINLTRKAQNPFVFNNIEERIRLTHTTDGHNKFYNMRLFQLNGKFIVECHFGRISTVGRKELREFDTYNKANKWMYAKFSTQLSKGYKRIDP